MSAQQQTLEERIFAATKHAVSATETTHPDNADEIVEEDIDETDFANEMDFEEEEVVDVDESSLIEMLDAVEVGCVVLCCVVLLCCD